MHIVHITSELAPIAKVGGLADVIHGLSQELKKLGHTVEILLPKYDCLHYEMLTNLKVEHRELWSFDGPYRFNNTIWSANADGLRVLLIEPHHPHYFFSRGTIYGCSDDIDRFAYFSRTAMEYLYKSGKMPDVIHAHDWPTALTAVLYKEMYAKLGLRTQGIVFTLHNIEHQGKCLPQHLTRIGLQGEDYLFPEKMQDPSSFRDLNLLKGGIVYADKITTVSPSYEKEIQTPEGGCGLQEVLHLHKQKLVGILNGIDEKIWNPEKDPHLVCSYPSHEIDEKTLPLVLAGKKENKRFLRTHLRLKESDAPLIASVTRLVPQKSPKLIAHAIEKTLKEGGQFVLLGSSPIPSIHQEFETLRARLLHNENVAILLDRDEALAHQIYAAADLFIIPSLFEPCGLTQLIALRYGTIPIARMIGGLADTVFDVDNSSKPLEERNGFTFDFPDTSGVNLALERAIGCYKQQEKKWGSLIINGMKKDYSWKREALNYQSLYETLNAPALKPVKAKEKRLKSA
jgi:starch synthase